MPPTVYRGGPGLTAKPYEVRADKSTGLLRLTRGISVHTDPAKVAKFGGAYEVVSLPPGLKIEQVGRDPGRNEIMPAVEMTRDEYQELA